MSDNVKKHGKDTCWFCKSRPSDENAKEEVELYRVQNLEQKYVVVAIKHTVEYEKTKVSVPRCLRCKDANDRILGIGITVWLILGVAASIWLIGYSNIGSQKEGYEFLGNIFGLILMFVFAGIPAGLLMKVLGENKEGAEQYPDVINLKAQGWKIGAKPEKYG